MYAWADLQLRLLQPSGPWHTKHGKAATAIHWPTSQKSQATRPGPIRKLWGSARVGLEVHGKVAWGMPHRYHTDPMAKPHRGGLAGERPWSKICSSETKKHAYAHTYRNTSKTYIRLAYINMYIYIYIYIYIYRGHISVRGVLFLWGEFNTSLMPGLDECGGESSICDVGHHLSTSFSIVWFGIH
jgi:hypothetical protein